MIFKSYPLNPMDLFIVDHVMLKLSSESKVNSPHSGWVASTAVRKVIVKTVRFYCMHCIISYYLKSFL